MKPYNNLSTQNLPLLLLITRITTVLALIAIVLSIVAFIASFFMKTGFVINQFFVLSTAIFPSAMYVLLGSGVVAAIIAFEESYRKKSEAYIASLN